MNSVNDEGQKQPMTDEDRLKLAQKLDADLEDFINNLPKKRYEDGWPEDRWEEVLKVSPTCPNLICKLSLNRKCPNIHFS